jgi:hypothetical protein
VNVFLKDDCLDLPKKTFLTRKIDLTGIQRKLYDEMRKYAISELEGKVCSTSTVMVSVIKTASNILWLSCNR